MRSFASRFVYSMGRLCCFRNESLSQYPLWNMILSFFTWKKPHPRSPRGSFHSSMAHSRRKFIGEHFVQRRFSRYWLVGDLMVHGVVGIQLHDTRRVGRVKAIYPFSQNFLRRHIIFDLSFGYRRPQIFSQDHPTSFPCLSCKFDSCSRSSATYYLLAFIFV